MSSRFCQALSVVLVVSGILVAAGCNTETATSGSQTIAFSITPNPGGIGRYTSATWIVRKIRVLPADPATAALYGADTLTLFFFPTDVDLGTNQAEFVSNIALSPGTYRVALLEVTPLVLIDENLSPNPATCIEGLAVIDGTKPCQINPTSHLCESLVPSEFAFSDPPNLTFTIVPGQTQLKLKVNIPALIAGYESMYTCTLGCGPGGTPCLTDFNEAIYRAAVLANIAFE